VPENLVLSYRANSISIDFAAIEPALQNQVNYQYKLEGYNDDWSSLSNNSTAVFGNLGQGHYTFKLKAAGPSGIWSETDYSFSVLPPWWATLWAYCLYAFLFIASGFGVYRIQKHQIIRIERERTREKELMQAREIEKAYKELKNTQAQLIQSEKMASLGELTAGIAHEIQNPLNFVNNFSEVNAELIDELKKELSAGSRQLAEELADDIKANQEKINHHGKRADAIVKGMLHHSRTSTGVKESTDINALCDEYLRLSYHGLRAKSKSFNAKFETDFDASLERINVVPQDIGRVVLNLINNAFYAVNEKSGQLSEGYEPTVFVSTKKDGSKISIRVKDNGNGIPESIKEKIFQPFFTTKPTGQGTGLGLSLSYDIIKVHGGEICLETKENEGSTFTIELNTKS